LQRLIAAIIVVVGLVALVLLAPALDLTPTEVVMLIAVASLVVFVPAAGPGQRRYNRGVSR